MSTLQAKLALKFFLWCRRSEMLGDGSSGLCFSAGVSANALGRGAHLNCSLKCQTQERSREWGRCSKITNIILFHLASAMLFFFITFHTSLQRSLSLSLVLSWEYCSKAVLVELCV